MTSLTSVGNRLRSLRDDPTQIKLLAFGGSFTTVIMLYLAYYRQSCGKSIKRREPYFRHDPFPRPTNLNENICAMVAQRLQKEAGRLVVTVAVGMSIARHPPHRPVRALLTHTVLTLDIWRRSAQ